MSLTTGQQIRVARAYLNWTQADLAERSGVSLPTIKRLERMGVLWTRGGTRDALETALTSAGIEFTPETQSHLWGVAMKKRVPEEDAHFTQITPSFLDAMGIARERWGNLTIDVFHARLHELVTKAEQDGAEDPWRWVADYLDRADDEDLEGTPEKG